MYKTILCIILSGGIFFGYEQKPVSTLCSVVMAGAIIKSKSDIENKKYPRKQCPICKGKGWYMSGDGIKKIDCNYCEPEDGQELTTTVEVR